MKTNILFRPKLPAGYKLAQIGEYQQAPSGNPAVIVLRDQPDTIFTEQIQYFLYAHNSRMQKNNVADLMGNWKAFMNGTGVGDEKDPRRNYILGEDLSSKDLPRIPKLITCALNTHAVRDYDNKYYQVWTIDGSKDPETITGILPRSIADIDSGKVSSIDYKYNPMMTPYAFIIPNNYNTKPDDQSTISPFPHGVQYSWTVEPKEIYQFLPLISMKKEPVLSEKKYWREVLTYKPYYRRL